MQYNCKRGTMVIPQTAKDHLQAHPEVLGLLPEALGRLDLPQGAFLVAGIEMGRIVGRSGAIETTPIRPDEPAMFAQRIGRRKPSRVVVGVLGPECSVVTVVARPSRDPGVYLLVTAFIGSPAPKEPWDNFSSPDEAQAALDFWSRFALVHTPDVMGEPFTSTWKQVLES